MAKPTNGESANAGVVVLLGNHVMIAQSIVDALDEGHIDLANRSARGLLGNINCDLARLTTGEGQ